MSVLKSLRVLACYNVLTPIALLVLATPGVAHGAEVAAGQSSGSISLAVDEDLTNNGTITKDSGFAAVNATVNIGTIVNGVSGVIDGVASNAIGAVGDVVAVTNDGIIRGSVADQGIVQIEGNVLGTFANTATGSISNTDEDGAAVFFVKSVADFTNAGSITAGSYAVISEDNDANVVHHAFDSFTNTAGGTIEGDYIGISISGTVGSFNNAGEINGVYSHGVLFGAVVDSLTNSGSISGAGYDGIRGTQITSFSNAADGEILGFINGVYLDNAAAGSIDSFSNAGHISGDYEGVEVMGDVGTFWNAAGGLIESTNQIPRDPDGASQMGVRIHGDSDMFRNDGTIRSLSDYSVLVEGAVTGHFINSQTGTIEGLSGTVLGAVASFDNAGTITGSADRGAYLASATAFANSSTGRIGGTDAVIIAGNVSTFDNAGIIAGNGSSDNNRRGVGISGNAGIFTNSGEISSETGIAIRIVGQVDNLINSGTILSGDGQAIVINATPFTSGSALETNDKVTLLTGSKIFGSVAFGGGTDTLDFAGFTGNTVLDVAGLETIVPGSRTYFDSRVAGTGQIAIVDLSGLNGQTIGKTLLDMLLTSNSIISGQLADTSSSEAVPMAFAPTITRPALNAVDTAVLSELDTLQKSGVKVWGGAFVGIGDAAPVDSASVFGGLVFGAHAAVDETFTLGGMGGYVSSSSQQGDDQMLASRTGLVGFYGQAALGVADIDFSLTVGASEHESTRLVVANNTTETANGLFTSMFIAPSASVTVPVLTNDAGEFAIKASATYVAGATSGYTEDGSSANLTVGSQSISVFDARIGVEGRHSLETSTLTSRAGVYVQANTGSSSVDVAAAGFAGTQTIATAGMSAAGVYGGVGLEADIGEGINLAANLDGSLGNDGTGSVSFKLGIGGSF